MLSRRAKRVPRTRLKTPTNRKSPIVRKQGERQNVAKRLEPMGRNGKAHEPSLPRFDPDSLMEGSDLHQSRVASLANHGAGAEAGARGGRARVRRNMAPTVARMAAAGHGVRSRESS